MGDSEDDDTPPYDDGIDVDAVSAVVSLRCREELLPGQFKCGTPVRRKCANYQISITAWTEKRTIMNLGVQAVMEHTAFDIIQKGTNTFVCH